MAALGKIRKRGVALVCIIGLGLFAFIAEEAFSPSLLKKLSVLAKQPRTSSVSRLAKC